jgi:hypothetical protein
MNKERACSRSQGRVQNISPVCCHISKRGQKTSKAPPLSLSGHTLCAILNDGENFPGFILAWHP